MTGRHQTPKKTIYTPRRRIWQRGGVIVFSTIVENIKSFFGKEERLLHQPQGVPEAASEVFEHPVPQPRKIVEKPLPETQRLPFSPEELRKALQTSKPRETPMPLHEERDISHEIDEFETTLQTVQPREEERIPQRIPRQDGFFDEFEQFLLHENLDTEGLLDTDILHRMKEFHTSRQEGREYYVYSKDVKAAMSRKLEELKTLEQEWFDTQQQIDELERGKATIEHEIEAHTRDLKGFISQAKGKSRLEKTVPGGREFILSDGRKLASLLDLKIALRAMPDTMFHVHVTSERNDFADWVRGAMQESAVADDLEKLRDKHQLDMYLSRLAG